MSSNTPSVTPPRGGLRQKVLLLLAVLATGGWLAHSLWFEARFVETDNAQVGGDILPVSSRISGFVAEVPVRENQAVTAGTLLAVLDARDATARLAQATAQVQQAEVEQVNAAQDAERLQALLARDLVSRAQVDAAVARASASRASVQAAQAAREVAVNQLNDTRIVAPTAGVISQKSVEPGQFLQPGQPMMRLAALGSVWVTANLKETELDGIGLGSPATVTVDAYPGLSWTGVVESLSPATGSQFTLLPPDNATGNFTKVVQRLPVRVRIAPGQHPAQPLRPGMSAVVTLTRR